MNKRLWMLLAGAAVVVAGFTPAMAQRPEEVAATPREYCGICEAKRSVQEVMPEWFTFGVDHRFRTTYHNNAVTLDKSSDPRESLFMRNRTRVWAKAEVVENIEIGARLVWEWFTFSQPHGQTPSSDVEFDELYIKANLADMIDQPLTVIAGRQNMRLGDGWLVFEGTPLDGSRTIYFNAIRAIYEMPDYDTTANLIFVSNPAKANKYIKPFNHGAVQRRHAEYDERAGILYLSNRMHEDMVVDGYFIYTNRREEGESNTVADIYTIGGRVAGDWDDSISYRAEAAFQFGKREVEKVYEDPFGDDVVVTKNTNLCGAWGLNSQVAYRLHDEFDTQAHVGYEIRSGGKTPERNFDILWGRYPQFSELLQGYTDTLEGRPAAMSNFHRFNVGTSMKPWADAMLLLDYHILFAERNNQKDLPQFGGGCLRGNLFTAQLKITHNEHMASTITGELFCPGDYYTSNANDVATFARYELMLVW